MKLYIQFTPESLLDATISNLRKKGVYGKIFVLSTPEKWILSFQHYNFLEGTLPINRNKGTNTLFSLNALNHIIKSVNSGVVDTSIKIEWSEYRNSLLLLNDGYLQILPTRLIMVVD